MSVNIVLPPLNSWAASRLQSILESKTESDFNTGFEETFALNCTFTVNGQTRLRAEYRALLLGQSAASFGEERATVNILEQTQVETGGQGVLSGSVGIFYRAVSESMFRVLGGATEKQETSSLNLVITPTRKNPQNPQLGIRGYFDPREVKHVDQVVAEIMPNTTGHTPTGNPLQPSDQGGPTPVAPGPVVPPSGTGSPSEVYGEEGELCNAHVSTEVHK